MEKLTKHLQTIDYVVASGSLGYGLITGSWLWISGGIAGLILAKANVGSRLTNTLHRKLRKKATNINLAVEEEAAPTGEGQSPSIPLESTNYAKLSMTLPDKITHSSKHSVLSSSSHLNHAYSLRR
jgi:hypothetical protein